MAGEAGSGMWFRCAWRIALAFALAFIKSWANLFSTRQLLTTSRRQAEFANYYDNHGQRDQYLLSKSSEKLQMPPQSLCGSNPTRVPYPYAELEQCHRQSCIFADEILQRKLSPLRRKPSCPSMARLLALTNSQLLDSLRTTLWYHSSISK